MFNDRSSTPMRRTLSEPPLCTNPTERSENVSSENFLPAASAQTTEIVPSEIMITPINSPRKETSLSKPSIEDASNHSKSAKPKSPRSPSRDEESIDRQTNPNIIEELQEEHFKKFLEKDENKKFELVHRTKFIPSESLLLQQLNKKEVYPLQGKERLRKKDLTNIYILRDKENTEKYSYLSIKKSVYTITPIGHKKLIYITVVREINEELFLETWFSLKGQGGHSLFTLGTNQSQYNHPHEHSSIVAAGEIFFIDNQLVLINDQSGTYNRDTDSFVRKRIPDPKAIQYAFWGKSALEPKINPLNSKEKHEIFLKYDYRIPTSNPSETSKSIDTANYIDTANSLAAYFSKECIERTKIDLQNKTQSTSTTISETKPTIKDSFELDNATVSCISPGAALAPTTPSTDILPGQQNLEDHGLMFKFSSLKLFDLEGKINAEQGNRDLSNIQKLKNSDEKENIGNYETPRVGRSQTKRSNQKIIRRLDLDSEAEETEEKLSPRLG
jgi:hypothetical protein